MALYEISVFDPYNPVFNPVWRQGMFVMPFMTRLGITDSWGGCSITGESVYNIGIWISEGVALSHIILSGMFFLSGKNKLTKKSMRNLWLHIFHLSTSRAILTHLSVVKIS